MSDYPYENVPVIHPAGTVLSVRFMGGLRHVGLATGYGTVIHSSARFGQVSETSQAKFSQGTAIDIIPYATDLTGSEIVARARGKIGQRYGVFTRNCEHFVNWVITGKAKSGQLGPLDLGQF